MNATEQVIAVPARPRIAMRNTALRIELLLEMNACERRRRE